MKRRNGFTLVELLVVIGIIAVLISVLVPALARSRQQAEITRCAALLREVANASVMYANANKGGLPPLRDHRGEGTYAFANAGVLQVNDWSDNKELGANLGRLVATRCLGNAVLPVGWNSGNAPPSPYYMCTSALEKDKDRFNYM